MRKSLLSVLLLLALLVGAISVQAAGPQLPTAALGSGFTYQGQLKDASGSSISNTCDFIFRLWNAKTGGAQVGVDSPVAGVSVSAGYFTAQVNSAAEFGATAFIGEARWLEISLRCPNAAGSYTTLSPRQELSAVPQAAYAAQAGSLPWSGLQNIPAGFADGTDDNTTYTAGSGLSLTSGAFSINFGGNGAAVTAARSDHIHSNFWRTNGNSQTDPATNYIGTLDNAALVFKVNGVQALRLEPNSSGANVIGGYSGNSVGAGVNSATVSGGGYNSSPNSVTSNFGTVGGGYGNSVSHIAGTVAGGTGNTASGLQNTIGGGSGNTSGNTLSTIAGGYTNTANGIYATVGGGSNNSATATNATVPGGTGALAGSFGQMAYASGNFSDPGDAQTSLYVQRTSSSDTAWHDLFLNGSDLQISVPSGHALAYEALIVGLASSGEAAGYRISGIVRNSGGVFNNIGTPSMTVLGEDDTAWDARFGSGMYPQTLAFQVRGNGESIRWVANVRTVEVALP